jgi:adenylate cyclase
MLGQLVPCGGGLPIPLPRPKLLVGRQTGCDIPLPYSTVSSRHCELELIDGYWFVRDLGSSNGTRVNGKPCESQRLLPNDVLTVAQYRYTVVYTPPAARPTPAAQPGAGSDRRPAPPAVGAPGADNEPADRANEDRSPGPTPLGQLVPCGGGDPIPLLKRKLVVGRGSDCDIVLRAATVSAHHCELEWTEDAWLVRDLGSHNGIRVDGARCEWQRLAPGSVLSIAGLRFELVDPRRGDRPSRKPSSFGPGLLEKAGLTTWQLRSAAAGRHRPGDPDAPRERYNLDDSG